MQVQALEAHKAALQPMPKYHCKDCTNCLKSGGDEVKGLITVIRCYCSCFKRWVEPDYNRCFYHSNYSPVHAVYQEPENLLEIVIEEEKKRCA